ncbi:hypothetical protein [Polynucleobacter sp. MWH-UH35A]|uniref:hypothetical protein n=1 Tax=Polynucleobacter sp. MWH-UH35A TaxID=1855619 RepID=UPI001BFEA0C7|nr:hypothetical protein [Polynucleobacter sp. MWH-UH35A]QWD59542.1 hypothetical protein ICV36_06945 [Polynucleobacter sp. MWH-UH35A]
MDSVQTAMGLVYLTFIASAIVIYLLHRKLDQFERYEFHNQSESGATTFDTYEGAKSFRRKQHFYKSLQRLAGFPFVFSLFIIIMYWSLSK